MPVVYTYEGKCYRCGSTVLGHAGTEEHAEYVLDEFATEHRQKCGASTSIMRAVGTTEEKPE